MSQNHDDESRFIFKSLLDEKENDVQDNDVPFYRFYSEEINSESTLNLNSNETLSKKKRNREKKNEESKPRNDNILKQVKVHSIEFITNTMNELMSDSINNFYKFNKNNVNKDFKSLTQKSLNIKLLNMTIKELLTENCEKKENKEVFEIFQKKFEENPEAQNLKLVDKFLQLSFKEIIKMFGMKNEMFFKEYQYNNKYLLEYKKCKNKKEMQKLIEYGIISFLEKKVERKNKK
jgi:hypothetical protein